MLGLPPYVIVGAGTETVTTTRLWGRGLMQTLLRHPVKSGSFLWGPVFKTKRNLFLDLHCVKSVIPKMAFLAAT